MTTTAPARTRVAAEDFKVGDLVEYGQNGRVRRVESIVREYGLGPRIDECVRVLVYFNDGYYPVATLPKSKWWVFV